MPLISRYGRSLSWKRGSSGITQSRQGCPQWSSEIGAIGLPRYLRTGEQVHRRTSFGSPSSSLQTDSVVPYPVPFFSLRNAMPQSAYWRCRNSPLFAATILGTDTSVLTQIPASIINSIHAFTGMSWPVTIISTTLAIRTITYPFTRNASLAGIRLVAFQPELESISVKEIQATEALDKIRLKELAIERQRIYDAANCQPRDMLLPLYVSAPLHAVLFAGLWNLGHASPMAVTSMAWIPHLGYPDPVGILPVAVLAMTQLSLALSAGVASNPSYSHAYNGARILSLVSSPILFIFPSTLCLVVISHACFSTMIALLYHVPAWRRFIGMGPLSDYTRPRMRDTWFAFRSWLASSPPS